MWLSLYWQGYYSPLYHCVWLTFTCVFSRSQITLTHSLLKCLAIIRSFYLFIGRASCITIGRLIILYSTLRITETYIITLLWVIPRETRSLYIYSLYQIIDLLIYIFFVLVCVCSVDLSLRWLLCNLSFTYRQILSCNHLGCFFKTIYVP